MGSSSSNVKTKSKVVEIEANKVPEKNKIYIEEKKIQEQINKERAINFKPINFSRYSSDSNINNKNNMNNNNTFHNNQFVNNFRDINKNNYLRNHSSNNIDKNNKLINNNEFIISPIQYNYEDDNEDCLELTNYFNKNAQNENQELEKLNFKFKNYINRRPNLDDEESILKQIYNKVNSNFGFNQAIQNDFDKMKTCLLYCSNLSNDDESFINKIEYVDLLTNNNAHKPLIIDIIRKNSEQLPQLIESMG